MSVWIVKRGTQYHAVWGWTRSRAAATRYLTREHAKRVCEAIHGARVILLRTRPASERLFLAERIKAWEPVVRAAVLVASADARGDIHSDVGVWAYLATMCGHIRALPEEHRP